MKRKPYVSIKARRESRNLKIAIVGVIIGLPAAMTLAAIVGSVLFRASQGIL